MRSIRRFIEVGREQGGAEVLRRASRRLRSSVELGAGLMSVSLNRLVGLSDRGLMSRVKPGWDSIDEFITHLRTKDYPIFPFSDETEEDFLAALKQYYPQEVTRTIQDAERVCHHEFRISDQSFKFPERINWHLDPVTGESWPKQYTRLMERWFWTEKRSYDPILVWGLNRHQHFATLGKAYRLTGDEKYAVECASQIKSWVRDNPCDIGINWFDALEIALRLISWTIAFHMMKTSDAFVNLGGECFIKSLYQQAHFLSEHLSVYEPVPNNHLIGEVTALILVGAMFPEFKDSEEWVQRGLDILEREIEKQNFDDGVNKEQSPSYQRFVLDFTLLALLLSEWNAIGEVPLTRRYTERMLDYIMHATGPDGRVPMIGDSGDIRGYKLSSGDNTWDFREKLAIGAVLYQRGDFKYVSKRFGEEAFWLLGRRGLETFKKLQAEAPDRISVSFPKGGHYIIRDSWEESSDFCLLRCGEFGLGGEGFCAHSHCDLLSFVLWIEGKPVIVDSGTYIFQGPWRDYFRLTPAHNTLLIDGKEQAVPDGYFAWRGVPNAACEHWSEDRVRGVMEINGVTVRREINHPAPGMWRITDMLSGQGEHTIEWFFHFSPGLRLKITASHEVALFGLGNSSLRLCTPDVALSIEEGWISPTYGLKQRNEVLHGCWQGGLSGGRSFVWEIVKSEAETSVTCSELDDAMQP